MPVKKPKQPSSRKKTGGVNLAPLLSAALLAFVKVGLDDIKKKKGDRATKSRSRTQTRTK
uniref:Uncharacterized protein n=1 Tax=viral metagenome TaxID=1070528 RepID=A0A6C0LFB9_9ZZZZ